MESGQLHMIILSGHYVIYKNYVGSLKVKATLHTYTSCISYSESIFISGPLNLSYMIGFQIIWHK